MARSLRKKPSSGACGLDIDGRFVAAAQVAGGRLTTVASAELPPGALADGEVGDRAALSGALREFADAHKLPRRVRIGVANQQIVVRMLDLPRIEDEAERTAALRYSAEDAIAMPLDEAIVDHQVAGYSRDGDGERMQVLVVAARRAMIEEYVAAVRDAGLKPDGVDLDAFALVRALAPPEDPAAAPEPEGALPRDARVYCHLGGVSNLAIALDDTCLFTRTLATPFDADGAAPAVADEIRMSIDYYMGQPGARPVGDVVLTGEGAGDGALVADIGAQLTLPVAAGAPLGALDGEAAPDDGRPYRYTVAAGLALGAAR